GSVALSLARPTDLDLVPVLVGDDVEGDLWDAVAAWAARSDPDDAIGWARTLGLPAAAVPDAPLATGRPPVDAVRGAPRAPVTGAARVLDLTSLWAGPLAARLLGLAGADVVKVESRARPDGARRGPAPFFDLLHAGHRSIALDLDDPDDRHTLRLLAEASDVVLEASRPRALRQLGLVAADLVAAGVTWASITAYGRDVDEGMRVGFGDDVAASAGLVAGPPGRPLFCGDAIADPLAGVTAAAAVASALASPHAWLLDVSMHDVCRVVAGLPAPPVGGTAVEPERPDVTGRAPSLGAHTDEVVHEWLA
ncbi:MAG: hypothetical protein JWP31_1247, partial [Aeromicrobium sp.]|nr:hypothetical protein [Aeromicrobium sp.]